MGPDRSTEQMRLPPRVFPADHSLTAIVVREAAGARMGRGSENEINVSHPNQRAADRPPKRPSRTPRACTSPTHLTRPS